MRSFSTTIIDKINIVYCEIRKDIQFSLQRKLELATCYDWKTSEFVWKEGEDFLLDWDFLFKRRNTI